MKKTQIDLQNETIEKVTNILRGYKNVAGAGIRGSQATNTNTPFSDIDLMVVFDTDERIGLRKIFDEFVAIKPTLSTLFQLFDKESLILFEDGVRLDIAFNKPTDFRKWISDDRRILLDPNNVIKELLEGTKGEVDVPGKPKWNDSEGVFQDWFFWMFRQAYCYTLQSTKVPTKSFEKLGLAIESISSVRNKLLDTVYYLEGKLDYLAKIDTDLKKMFIETYPGFEVKSILKSVNRLVDLYEIIIKKYCIKENLYFPKDKVVTIKKLFLEFDSYL